MTRLRALVPLPAPAPRRAWMVPVVLLVTAWLLLLPAGVRPGTFPGDAALPDGPVTVNAHWQLASRGAAGWLSDDLHGFPFRHDRAVSDGVPVAEALSAPLLRLFGVEVGLWAWAVAVLWLGGAAAGWLGMRWWGSVGAGILAGAGFQVAEASLREVAAGRIDTVFAAAFLPLALLGGVAAARGGPLPAAGAGVAAGLATLGWGPFALPGLAFALGPQLPFRRGLTTFAAFVVVCAFPAAWLWSGRGEAPGLAIDPFSPVSLGFQMVRPVDLALARIHGPDGVMFGTLARPVLLALAAWAAWTCRLRHAWLPVAAGCTFALLGLGALLPGPVAAPWGWLSLVPGWPWEADRMWVVPGLCLALLAAGAPLRGWLAGLGAFALLEEAVLLSAALPFPALELRPAATAVALARAPDVPLVLLPVGQGQFRQDRMDLVDQVSHGRPLAQGTGSPFDLTEPDAVQRGWRTNRGLRAFAACESGRAPDVEGAAEDLLRAGLVEVWLDPRYLAEDDGYRACVASVLPGWRLSEAKPLVRWQAP